MGLGAMIGRSVETPWSRVKCFKRTDAKVKKHPQSRGKRKWGPSSGIQHGKVTLHECCKGPPICFWVCRWSKPRGKHDQWCKPDASWDLQTQGMSQAWPKFLSVSLEAHFLRVLDPTREMCSTPSGFQMWGLPFLWHLQKILLTQSS